ncbi:hypothetical protein [Enterobacter hormaechei]|uniref:hypothetical protein n=1 Tax=Enterobacter hormaechei TaxID=158836 RepID=UPI001C156D57|nr:hypothetical protein [Enterobacter hormaechei subsp. xiangfangensis]
MSEEESKTIFQKGFDIAVDRIKNNFYGYLITSFAIFNWENIILILKSKNDIEMTLIYISVQPNFAHNFFWEPLKWGILASFVMPLISTIYCLSVGVITSFRDESRKIGQYFFDLLLSIVSTSISERKLVSGKLAERLKNQRLEFDILKQRTASALEQKAKIDEFLLKVARAYALNPKLNDEKDLEKIFKALYHEDLRDMYSEQSIIGRFFELLEEDNKARAQNIAAAQFQANNAQAEK